MSVPFCSKVYRTTRSGQSGLRIFFRACITVVWSCPVDLAIGIKVMDRERRADQTAARTNIAGSL